MPGGKRPWSGKPGGKPGAFGDRKPWQDRPRDPNRKPFNPRAPRTDGRPPRKRNDDPDRD